MSRLAVRSAVAAFLAGAAVPGLQKVYEGYPWFTPGETLDLAALGGSAAFAWVEVGESSETRWSVPASYPGYTGSGNKGVHYPVVVIVEFQYLIPQQVFPPVNPDAWTVPEDGIIQGIKDRIHSDPTLGAPAVIFSAAQEPNGLRVSPDNPVFEPGKVLSTREIDFRVTEVIQA